MRKFLEEISPTARAHESSKPMLISQGANDPRVPESESEQIVKQIRKPDAPVWYILAKDEGTLPPPHHPLPSSRRETMFLTLHHGTVA